MVSCGSIWALRAAEVAVVVLKSALFVSAGVGLTVGSAVVPLVLDASILLVLSDEL